MDGARENIDHFDRPALERFRAEAKKGVNQMGSLRRWLATVDQRDRFVQGAVNILGQLGVRPEMYCWCATDAEREEGHTATCNAARVLFVDMQTIPPVEYKGPTVCEHRNTEAAASATVVRCTACGHEEIRKREEVQA